jgi:hypothetical protein
MKAHRFKSRVVTAQELYSQFCEVRNLRIAARVRNENPDIDVVGFMEKVSDEKVKADETLKLLKEYESKGRKTSFYPKSFFDLLNIKHFGTDLM